MKYIIPFHRSMNCKTTVKHTMETEDLEGQSVHIKQEENTHTKRIINNQTSHSKETDEGPRCF